MKNYLDFLRNVDCNSIVIPHNTLTLQDESFDLGKLPMIKNALRRGCYPLDMNKIDLDLIAIDHMFFA